MIASLVAGRLGLEAGLSRGGELGAALPLTGPSFLGARLDFAQSTLGVDEYSVLYLLNTSAAYVAGHFTVSGTTYTPSEDDLGLFEAQQSGRYATDPVSLLWTPVMAPNTLVTLERGELLSPYGLDVRGLGTSFAAQVLIPVELQPGEFVPLIVRTRLRQFMPQVARYSTFLSVACLHREAESARASELNL